MGILSRFGKCHRSAHVPRYQLSWRHADELWAIFCDTKYGIYQRSLPRAANGGYGAIGRSWLVLAARSNQIPLRTGRKALRWRPDEINSSLKGIIVNIGQESANILALSTTILAISTTLISTLAAVQNIATAIYSTFPRISGTFTLANATLTVVTQPSTGANAVVTFTPKNATGALTLRTQGLFHATNTAGASFTLSTQSGSALGTETFEYVMLNPS